MHEVKNYEIFGNDGWGNDDRGKVTWSLSTCKEVNNYVSKDEL